MKNFYSIKSLAMIIAGILSFLNALCQSNVQSSGLGIGKVPVASGTYLINDGIIQDNGTGVGIGLGSSGYKLNVGGTINLSGAITGATTISASSTITSNGHNNSNGGITNAGAISGATTISASSSISGTAISGTTITGSDDFDASSSTKGYKIGGSYVLRHINGSSNILVGPSSGASITSGTNNSFFGNSSGNANTTGAFNTFLGYGAGIGNTTGNYNTINGHEAGRYNATGSSNSIYGYQSGYGVSTYSFSEVSFLGYRAGYGNKGNYNTFLGTYSGYSNAAAGYNTFVGYASGYANNSASNTYNTFIGHNSGRFSTSGNNNAFLGHQSGYNNTTGYNNTFVGVNAGYNNTTGYSNVALGPVAGDSYTNLYNSVFIGAAADANSSGYNNTAAFGYNAVAQSSDKFYFGNAYVTECKTTSWVSTSDGRFKFNVKEEVKGLEFIKKLRPVTYQMNTQQLNTFLRQDALQAFPDSIIKNSSDTAGFAASSNIIHSGFIAQEIQQAALECGFSSSIVSIPSNNNKETYGINYGEIVVPLVKAIQELSATIDSLKGVPTAKKATQDNDSLIKRIEQLESLMNQCCTANSDGQNQNSERQGTTIKENQMELISAAMLYQNSPNPFGDGTTIKYFVPENSQAQIIFYDEFGSMLKEFKVEEKGMGQLNISASNLAAGVYSYSLIINGKVMDTKKMSKIK